MKILKTVTALLLGLTLLSAENLQSNPSPQNDALKEYQKYNALATQAWEKMPFSIQKYLLVAKETKGFGMYEKRKSNKYLQGENVMVYVEPIGFGYRDLGGFYGISMESDLIIKNEKGETLGKIKSFGKFNFHSNIKNREIFLSFVISLGHAPAGKYEITVPIRDNIKNQTANITLNIEIVK